MPATSRREGRVLETYAHSLLEAGKAEGRVFENRRDLEVLASASPELLAVLTELVQRDQLDILPAIADAYRTMTEEDDEVVGVTVTTAVPLDDALRASLTERCERELGRKVFLIEHVDPSIIGGIVLEARGQRRDISVKTRLRAMRDNLASIHPHEGGAVAHG
ncbi:F0F1 ATP synthase subunit delta [Enorma burkinafasonensis]|uniref:F0F1 ATP synthase subunit delta n=1 Tax=Enorma burkinafasonensis TaxID=2590867 RepID=UPI0011AA7314|nr:F0F1 ATP synthase subunit delta [Enorma burkinafasonensis]